MSLSRREFMAVCLSTARAAAGLLDPGIRLTTMKDEQCVAFLQWALQRLGMRCEGFRKVRRQVCRCIRRRTEECGARSQEE